ncbi:MAG: DUF4412 domain-containing protein [Myxococcota bacterium]
MMAVIVLGVLAGAPSFEGLVDLELRSAGGNGALHLAVSRRGLRGDLAVPMLGKTFRTQYLVSANEPDTIIGLDPVRRTSQRLPLTVASGAYQPRTSRALSAERVGRETVQGIACERVRVTGPDFAGEYWVATTLLPDARWAQAMRVASRQGASVDDALARLGVTGLVLKMSVRTPAGETSLVPVKVEARALAPELFSVPADFRPVDARLAQALDPSTLAHLQELPVAQREAVLRDLLSRAAAAR